MTLHPAYRDFTNLPPLAPDEKMSPFAKYYTVPVEQPAPEILAGIDYDHQMDPAKALPIDQMEKLFTPGYTEVENGYCVMPDGTGYSAAKIEMPNVSPEEFMKFNIYGHVNSIQYKTWLPKMHIEQGAFTIEDFGWGPLLFHQRQMLNHDGKVADMTNPKEMTPDKLSAVSMKGNGIDIADPKALDPNFFTFVGGSVYMIDVLTGDRNDITMVNYLRKKGDGLELRVRVWFGLAIHGKEVTRMIPEDAKVPADKVCAIVTHNAFEWTRANTIAHDVCEDMKKMAGAGNFPG